MLVSCTVCYDKVNFAYLMPMFHRRILACQDCLTEHGRQGIYDLIDERDRQNNERQRQKARQRHIAEQTNAVQAYSMLPDAVWLALSEQIKATDQCLYDAIVRVRLQRLQAEGY